MQRGTRNRTTILCAVFPWRLVRSPVSISRRQKLIQAITPSRGLPSIRLFNHNPTPPQPDEGCSTIPISSLRRLREDDPNADGSEERSKREGPVKRARFRGSVEEETSNPAEPPARSAHPTPSKRPPLLRRAFGFGSAGRGGHRPTDAGVHKRPDATAASRRTRSSGTSASKQDLANARRKLLATHQAKGRFKNLSVT